VRMISPSCGRFGRVGVITGVGKGVLVAVGGNQTIVGVGVAVGGGGVSVRSGGKGASGRQPASATIKASARASASASARTDRPTRLFGPGAQL
jgi:hypothetical protein